MENKGYVRLIILAIILLIGIGTIVQECRQAKIERIIEERHREIYGPDPPPRTRPVY